MSENPKLQKTYFINVIIINLLSIVFLGSVWVVHEFYQYKSEVDILRNEFIESQKTTIKNEVENAIEYIDKINTKTETDLKAALELRSTQIIQVIKSVYLSHSNHGLKQKELLIKQIINQISKNTFVFVMDGNKVENLGSSSSNFQKYWLSDQKNLIDKLTRFNKKSDIYFRHDIRTNDNKIQQLVLYFEEFKPLNWTICIGMDYNKFVNSRQYDVIERLSHIRFGKNREGYLFANVQNADPLLTNGIITIGQPNNWNLEDPYGIKIMQEQNKAAQKPAGDFIQYSWRKIFTAEEKAYGIEKPTSPKISFIKGYKPWNWMIGAGFYIDDIEIVVAQKKELLYQVIRGHIAVIGIALLVSIFLTLGLIRIIQKRLNLSFSRFTNFFNEASTGKAEIELDKLYYQEFKELAAYANKMVEQRELAEHGFKQIVELFPFPICIYNKNTIIYVNPQWIKVIGYNLNEIPTLSRTLIKCFPDKLERKMLFQLQNAEIAGAAVKEDQLFKVSCKNEQTLFMKLNYIEMKNNNSMITLEDYSLRKKIEDDLNAARLKAEESDSLKSAFLANMSHEIRTPMNAIIGFSGLLQKENLAEEKRKRYLSLILKSSESLLNLINDILDISKIEAGQLSFQIVKGNLADTFSIVDEEIKSIRATMGKQNIQIISTYNLTNEEGFLETDFLRLKQVLMNLLSNSLKFTHEGYIEYGCSLLKANTLDFL